MGTSYALVYGEAKITGTCEKCGKAVAASRILKTTVSDSNGKYIGSGVLGENTQSALKTLEKQRIEIFTAFENKTASFNPNLPVAACPACGHFQSWMLNSLREVKIKKMSQWAGIILGLAAFILTLVFIVNDFKDVPLGLVGIPLAAGLVVFGIIYLVSYLLIAPMLIKKPKRETLMLGSQPHSIEWKPIYTLNNEPLSYSYQEGIRHPIRLINE